MSIVYKTGGAATNSVVNTNYSIVTVSAVAGETILVAVVTTTSPTITVSDSIGSTYTALGSASLTSCYLSFYGTANISAGVSRVFVTYTKNPVSVVAVSTYSGVTGFNTGNESANTNSGTGTAVTISSMAAHSWMVMGLGVYNSSGTTISASVGNLRNYYNPTASRPGAAVFDNTSDSLTYSLGATSSSAYAAVEMTSSSAIANTGHGGTASNVTQGYIMRAPVSVSAGSSILVVEYDTPYHAATISDSQGNTYANYGGLYLCTNITLPVAWVQASLTVTYTGYLGVEGYGGVSGWNTTNYQAGSGTGSVSLTLPNSLGPHSWTAGGFFFGSIANDTVTASTGSLRNHVNSGSSAAISGGNVDSSSGKIIAASASANPSGSGAAVELTAYAPSPRVFII